MNVLSKKIRDNQVEGLLLTLVSDTIAAVKQGKTEEKVTELVEAAKKELYTLIK